MGVQTQVQVVKSSKWNGTLEGVGWGHRHLMKDPVVLSSCWECSLSDCGNLNFLSFCVNQISASKCVQSDIPDTAHVAWLSPLMSVFLTSEEETA